VSFEVVAPNAGEMAARIAAVTEQYPWLVLDRAGGIAGYAYATKHRERAAYAWAVDTAVYVEAAARRSGVGRALYDKLFALLVEQGYFVACAGIALPNPASVALHTAVGFTPVGTYHKVGYKLGAWHDVAWFERRLQPERPDPPPPRPVSAVLHVL
jgi:phosphinothricin acetyltransferase